MANLNLIGPGGEVYELSGPVTGLGRAADNQIVVNSNRLSRYHAQIVFSQGQYWLRDLGSKNGSRVNGQPVQGEQKLAAGDHIMLGDVQFTFEIGLLETETASYFPPENLARTPVRGLAPVLQLDLAAMEVKLNGQVLAPPLSLLEWKLLVLLYQNQGKVCSRDLIIETVYQPLDPENTPYDSAIETLVSRVRKALKMADPNQKPYIRAIRGVGYKLELV